MSARLRLGRLLRAKSVRTGRFTLASGRESDYYIDARLTTMSGEGQLLVGEVCHQAIVATEWSPDHVGGMTLGADPVAYAIAREATGRGRPIDAFTVRKAAKAHGARRRIEGCLAVGARAVVVDDAVTTGGSLLAAARAVENFGAEVVGVVALVDREEGARELLAEAGYDFRPVFAARELLAELDGSVDQP